MESIKMKSIDILFKVLTNTKKAGQKNINVNEIINLIKTLKEEEKGGKKWQK